MSGGTIAVIGLAAVVGLAVVYFVTKSSNPAAHQVAQKPPTSDFAAGANALTAGLNLFDDVFSSDS